MGPADKTKAPAITAEEMERSRKMVRSAFRSNAMEGFARTRPASRFSTPALPARSSLTK